MKAMLTSDLGASTKVDGKWVPSVLHRKNGLLDTLAAMWPKDARVLIISADPDEFDRNDSVYACLKEALPMSGLSVSVVENCDSRNLTLVEELHNMDVIILAGGHVPTQNRFMKQLRLRERLQGYQGIVVGWSAGSMNCADVVYAGPELEGEAVDPEYQRWISGLGITEINIFPHFQSLREEYLDGLRLIEDITYQDSMVHEIIAINDGSYIMIDDGKAILYGEAYCIKNGKQTQICRDGEFISL